MSRSIIHLAVLGVSMKGAVMTQIKVEKYEAPYWYIKGLSKFQLSSQISMGLLELT